MTMPGAVADQLREADVVLRDGTTVRVRPACSHDAAGLRQLFERLSPDSRYLRFFSGAVDTALVVHWAADVDHVRGDGLVAVTGTPERIVGHAGWERGRERPERAEVALVLDDQFQGRGLGTILLGELAEGARARGVKVFTAEVLPNNYRMIQVFQNSGFDVRVRSVPGLLLVEFPTMLTPDALRRFEEREECTSCSVPPRSRSPAEWHRAASGRPDAAAGHRLVSHQIDGGVHHFVIEQGEHP